MERSEGVSTLLWRHPGNPKAELAVSWCLGNSLRQRIHSSHGHLIRKAPHFAFSKAVPRSRRLLWVPWALWRGAGGEGTALAANEGKKGQCLKIDEARSSIFSVWVSCRFSSAQGKEVWEHKHHHKHLKFASKWPLTRFGVYDSSLWCHRNEGSVCHLATSPNGVRRQQRKAANAETPRTASVWIAPFSASCTWKVLISKTCHQK